MIIVVILFSIGMVHTSVHFQVFDRKCLYFLYLCYSIQANQSPRIQTEHTHTHLYTQLCDNKKRRSTCIQNRDQISNSTETE